MNPKPKVVKKVIAWGFKNYKGNITRAVVCSKKIAEQLCHSITEEVIRVEIREVKR